MLRLPQNPEEICLLLSANPQYVLAFAEQREAFEAAASGESHVYAGCPICMLAVKSSCALLLQATKFVLSPVSCCRKQSNRTCTFL